MNMWSRQVFLIFISLGILSAQSIPEEDIFGLEWPQEIRRIQESVNISLSIAAVGDLMMGGSALPVILREGVHYPYVKTRSILKSSDIAIANLEAPFTKQGNPFEKKYTFRVQRDFAAGLKEAGIQIVTLANNHILDYGPEGLSDTIDLLDSLNIYHCGAGNDISEAEKGAIIEKGKWRIGFLAYSLTYPDEFWATSEKAGTAYPAHLKKNILSLKSRTDFLVVSFHWGSELMTSPKAYQKYYAHLAVETGADLVIGHHPHVLQGIEYYKEGLIAYSLGNYIFGSYSRNSRESMILKIYFDDRGYLSARIIPIDVNNYTVQFQPAPLEGDKRRLLIRTLNELSKPLNLKRSIIKDSGWLVREPLDEDNSTATSLHKIKN